MQRTITIFILCIICSGAGIIDPAGSVPSEPGITLTPTNGPPGTTVRVTGSGFTNDTTITILFDGSTVKTTTSGSRGTFSTTFVVPQPKNPGNYNVAAKDNVNAAFATFTVTAAPSIALNPTNGIIGRTVTVTGMNFPVSSTVRIRFDNVTVPTIPATVVSSSSGDFTATLQVPNATVGSHTVSASVGAKLASTPFTVVASPTVILSPPTGAAGIEVKVVGSGFTADSTVTIRFDSIALETKPTTIVASSSGKFFATITIPLDALTGAYTITSADLAGGTATTQFGITTSGMITLPAEGSIGGTITISGSGFGPSNVMTFKFDSTVLDSKITTNKSGAFNFTITIPIITTIGVHTISATDASERTASAVLNVIKSGELTISPPTGPIGTTVTVRGENFAANTRISIKFNGNIIATTFPSNILTGNGGSFVAKFDVPAEVIGGRNTVLAIDETGRTGLATFIVPGQESTISLSPSTGRTGSTVTVTGSGFVPNTPVTIRVDGNLVNTNPAVATTNKGTFTATFVVPSTYPVGGRTVSTSDGINSASATLTLMEGSQERLAFSNLKIVDQTGLPVKPSAGMKILIQSDLKNNLQTDQNFVYVVQVKDSQGAVAMISWISSTLLAEKQYAVAQSWLVDQGGSYRIEVFAWESITVPNVLAPALSIIVGV